MWNEDEVMELEFVLEEHTCCYSREETAEVIRRAYEKIWDEAASYAPEYMPKNPYRKEN